MQLDRHPSNTIHDLLGIGFGPSNLALALALDEARQSSGRPLDTLFLERKPAFAWHSGMLLQDSRMQISFLKDLVTLRNPSSPYSFLKYLQSEGRLEAFVNLRTFLPSRIEYDGYLRWAASFVADHVRYGETVIAIRPHLAGNKVRALQVLSRQRDGREISRLAAHLVVAVGGRPALPAPLADAQSAVAGHVVHSSDYLPAIETLLTQHRPAARQAGRRLRVAVLGGGQSGAEIFQDLVQRANAEDDLDVSLIIRGSALKPADDSPFVNEIFNADFTNDIYHRTPKDREKFFGEYRGTNYSVIDLDLLERLYALFYMQKVSRQPRHTLLVNHDLIAAASDTQGVLLTFDDLSRNSRETLPFDIVVAATGYHRDDHRRLLGDLAPYLGDFTVRRDYRLATHEDCLPGIWLQGGCEATHGLSDTLLSVLAIRSAEISRSIYAAQGQRVGTRPVAVA